jgi:hypothetical protein
MTDLVQEKYHFADFTTEHYRYIIRKTKENYLFSAYDSFNKQDKFVLCRHDVDLSPHRALRLAEIEQEEGVTATYFWHLHSEYYNLFEKEIFDIVKKINSLGHHFGIHFDTHFYNILNQQQIEAALKREKQILEDLFEVEINVFSFHNTNPFIMSCQEWKYAGLINTYANYFQKEVTYCSDSNGYWRYQRMANIIEKGIPPRLQLLTHPEWWTEELMSPWQKIQRAVDGRRSRALNYYQSLLKNGNMKNIDWEGEV